VTPNQTLKQIITLIAEASAVDANEVRPEGQLRGYGIDSARVVDLVVGIEETFGVTLKETDLAGLTTVRDLAELVERLKSP
jgi:acyl carrier protein